MAPSSTAIRRVCRDTALGLDAPPGKPGNADSYPWRFETEPELVLDEDDFVPAVELAGELEHVAKWPAEHWTLAFQGQLRVVSDADSELLERRLRQAAPAAA